MSLQTAPDIQSSFDWEAWLFARFPAYLRGCAVGEKRPREAIEEALARLSGDRRAFRRLSAIAWLLDPAFEVDGFVTKELPRYLRTLTPRTERVVEERQGAARGRIDWKRTLDLRRRANDQSWLVTVTPRRTFDSPGLRLVRWILEQVDGLVAVAAPGGIAESEKRWKHDLARIYEAMRQARRHAALRDLPYEPMATQSLRAACSQDRDPFIRKAADLAGSHARMFASGDADLLLESLQRFSLAPFGADQRFELFTLLSARERFEEILGVSSEISLVEEGRSSVARWSFGDSRLQLYYDQPAPSARHQEVMRKFFGVTAGLRPDVRAVMERSGKKIALVIDAKNSDSLAYLASSDLKMLGYVSDGHPEVWLPAGPQAVIVSQKEANVASPTERISFVGPRACGTGGALEAILREWFSAATKALAGGPNK